jgi:hypothetical protein
MLNDRRSGLGSINLGGKLWTETQRSKTSVELRQAGTREALTKPGESELPHRHAEIAHYDQLYARRTWRAVPRSVSVRHLDVCLKTSVTCV